MQSNKSGQSNCNERQNSLILKETYQEVLTDTINVFHLFRFDIHLNFVLVSDVNAALFLALTEYFTIVLH